MKIHEPQYPERLEQQKPEPTYYIDACGTKRWRLNGKPHREDGPAIEYQDGRKVWMQFGNYHRIGGPALEWADGTKMWYQNGMHHRTDGPAIIYSNGVKEYWIDEERYEYAVWKQICNPFNIKCLNTCVPNKSKPIVFVL
jgi:hypothetical protein